MPDEVVQRPLGRVSEPSHSTVPLGSMLRADNCVLRSPGALSPTPDPTNLIAGSSAYLPVSLSDQYDNGSESAQLMVVDTGSPAGTFRARSSQAPTTDLPYAGTDGVVDQHVDLYRHAGGALDFDYTTFPFHVTRGNLYTCDKRSVYKWQNTDATELTPVRDVVAALYAFSVGGGGTDPWMPVDTHVGYTMVVVYTDANGVVRRSYPLQMATEAVNDVGVTTTCAFQPFIHLSSWTDDVTAIEIYRTRTFPTSVTLPNEYYLVATLDPADFVDAGPQGLAYCYGTSAIIEDVIRDDELGAALYTSSSQGGALAANVTPPEHLYHATFRGFEFWANVAEKELFPELLFDGAFSAFKHTITGTITAGSANVTGVASVTGLAVGMLASIFEGGSAFPLGTYITAITGAGPYTVTMSEVADSNAAQVVAYETILVRTATGESYRIALDDNILIPVNVVSQESAAIDIVSIAGKTFTIASPWDLAVTLGMTTRTARSGPSQMWVTTPALFQGLDWAPLSASSGNPAYGTGTDALPALHKRRIYWSKLQEPEHTTLVNFEDVGTEAQIVGLGALTDALLILTAKGVYRLTGSGGTWRIDPLDTSVDLIGGRASQVMGNALYTLGDRGMLRINTTGVENLSDGVVGDWFAESGKLEPALSRLQGVRQYLLNYEGYHPLFLLGACDAAHREYSLFCESYYDPAGVDEAQTYGLVYNSKTGAFTTFTPSTGVLFAVAYARGFYLNRSVAQEPGITYVLFALGSAALVLQDNVDGSGYTVHTQDIAFRASLEGDPTHIKKWLYIDWDLLGHEAVAPLTAVYQDSEEGAEITQSIAAVRGNEVRIVPPRNACRCTKLVNGLRGNGLTIYGCRLSFVSSGRNSPLTASAPNG